MLARWSPLTFDVSTCVFALFFPPHHFLPTLSCRRHLRLTVFFRKQVFSPRTPRQKTPLVQRWESGLINGHNEEDDWRCSWKKSERDNEWGRAGEGGVKPWISSGKRWAKAIASPVGELALDLFFSWKTLTLMNVKIIIITIIIRKKQNVWNQHKGQGKHRKLQYLEENHLCLIDWRTITTSLTKSCKIMDDQEINLTFVDFYRHCFHGHWLNVVVL